MIYLLAKAEGPDPTDSNLVLVVVATAIVAAVCLLAAIPIATAKRRLGQTEGIAAIMVIWGLLAAGSAIWFTNAQMAFNKEYMMRIMQDYDARDLSGRPSKPWVLWGFLAAGYGGAVLWSATAKSAAPRGFDVDTGSSSRDMTQ